MGGVAQASLAAVGFLRTALPVRLRTRAAREAQVGEQGLSASEDIAGARVRPCSRPAFDRCRLVGAGAIAHPQFRWNRFAGSRGVTRVGIGPVDADPIVS